jgi:hypothetical protein
MYHSIRRNLGQWLCISSARRILGRAVQITAAVILNSACLTEEAGGAVIFNFTITGDNSTFVDTNNKVLGTVTGSVTLPDGDGTHLPLSISIGSYPVGIGGEVNQNLFPTTWQNQLGTGFVVSGGQIIGANWLGQQADGGPTLSSGDQIRFNYDGFNSFRLTGLPIQNYPALSNASGFSGVTYSSIPESASHVFLGLFLAGAACRRTRP